MVIPLGKEKKKQTLRKNKKIITTTKHSEK